MLCATMLTPNIQDTPQNLFIMSSYRGTFLSVLKNFHTMRTRVFFLRPDLNLLRHGIQFNAIVLY